MTSNNQRKENPRLSLRYLVISLQDAKISIVKLKELNAINPKYRITRNEGNLYIPLVDGDSFLDKIEFKYQIIDNTEKDFPIAIQRKKSKPNLKDALKSKLPPHLHDLIPRSFDIIGNIAIIELNRNEQELLSPFKNIIGHTILEINPHLTTVLEKQGDVEGVYRTRPFDYLAGIKTKTTLYKENNCQFRINLGETFFTPRLAYERARIALIDSPFNSYGIIWDMFCGIGPFFIQIAKNYPNIKIIATDINPYAIKLSHENIQLNRINNDILCIQQNVTSMPDRVQGINLKNSVSRIIMNLPEQNLDFLPILPHFLHPKGTLFHIYQFNPKPHSEIAAINELRKKIAPLPLEIVKILNTRIVKPFSPVLDTTALDLIIRRKEE